MAMKDSDVRVIWSCETALGKGKFTHWFIRGLYTYMDGLNVCQFRIISQLCMNRGTILS